METNTIDLLTKRYIELRDLNKKTHLCYYWFRQRCLKSKETCQFAHGISDLKRMPSHELLKLRQELFNIKQKLKKLKYAVMFNWKTKRYETYKLKHLKALKQKMQESGGDLEIDLEFDEAEEEEGDEEEEKKVRVKKCVLNIDFEQSTIIEEIDNHYKMTKFDMNKVMDSDDEINMVKRKPRNKTERDILKPWQNDIMAKFLLLLFQEAGDSVLPKTTVI